MIRLASVVNAEDLVVKLGRALIYFVLIVKSLGMVVTRMDTPKYGETLKFMYIKYQLILVVLPKVYQV